MMPKYILNESILKKGRHEEKRLPKEKPLGKKEEERRYSAIKDKLNTEETKKDPNAPKREPTQADKYREKRRLETEAKKKKEDERTSGSGRHNQYSRVGETTDPKKLESIYGKKHEKDESRSKKVYRKINKELINNDSRSKESKEKVMNKATIDAVNRHYRRHPQAESTISDTVNVIITR